MGKREREAKQAKRRKKVVVGFDAEARREYLTGFSKRKKQRRDEFMDSLEKRVKKERAETRRGKKVTIDVPCDGSSDDEAEAAKAGRALEKLTGHAAQSETVTHLDDSFSKQAFGNIAVTVTVTTTGVDEADKSQAQREKEERKGASWGSFSGEKNVKLEVGKAEKMLQRLKNQFKGGGKKGGHAKAGGKTRSKKRIKKRTGAKERRRRK